MIGQSILNTVDVYDDGFLLVEHKNYHVECGNEPLKLGRAEFLVVSLLVQKAERFVSAKTIWNHLWNGSKPLNFESLKVMICRLRRKFAPFGIRIETMVSFGYKLVPAKRASK
jgi:DNA-binding response OmpR family regulator